MVKVKILKDFKVEATSEVYIKGWEGEVSDKLAERHGAKGTGFLQPINVSEVKSTADIKKPKK